MKVKTYINISFILTFVSLILLCGTSEIKAQSTVGSLRKVVIDAGHGGKDPGTTYGKIYEKNITLSVALLLGQMIKDNLPEVEVHYTRTTDVYVGLAERGDIANKLGADLFISIHVDANNNSSASGSTTYVMGVDKTNANLEVAMRENDIIKFEEDYTTKYEGYIPGSTESFIIFTLMQYAYLDQSMDFANTVQKHYMKNTPMKDRGARQAPYLVLWKTAMPSVLTETGFLSNAEDRKTLTTDAGQQKIARSLFNAFSEYKTKVDGNSNPVFLSANNETKVSSEPSSSAGGADQNAYYSVQLCSSDKPISTKDRLFKDYRGKVVERKVGSLYKYYYGNCSRYSEVLDLQRQVRKTIDGAFAVGILNEQVVSAAQVREIKE